MKKTKAILLNLLILFILSACSSGNIEQAETQTNTEQGRAENSTEEPSETIVQQPSNRTNNGEQSSSELVDDVIIIYYSRTGNTEKIASIISEATGANLVHLETVEPYSDDDNELLKMFGDTVESYDQYPSPELATKIENLDQYKYVFIGTPVWYDAPAMPVRAFLETYTFTEDQIILPFATHMSTGQGAYEKMMEIQPDVQMASLFDKRGYTTEDIINWINENIDIQTNEIAYSNTLND